ncbi:MAG TPA: hypothetical protein VGV93_09740 [Acidimicrobiales bacterium]|nr:hypothetical protein [Acidimicrobiales bacterium]
MAEHDPLSGDGDFIPSADFIDLLDEGRATEVRAARAREHALRRMAEEGAQLAGTLIDLAERRSPVILATVAGRHHHGVVVGVGGDYCVVRTDGGVEIHLCLDALTTLRPAPGERHVVASGERRPPTDHLLLEVLGRAVGDRRPVSLVTRTGEVVAGELRAVGMDVVSLSPHGNAGETCYVAASAVSEAFFAD